MGFNCLKATDESLRGDSLLFTTHYLGVPGGHLIDLGRMKGSELTLKPPSGFDPVTPCAFLSVETISSSGSHCFY